MFLLFDSLFAGHRFVDTALTVIVNGYFEALSFVFIVSHSVLSEFSTPSWIVSIYSVSTLNMLYGIVFWHHIWVTFDSQALSCVSGEQ